MTAPGATSPAPSRWHRSAVWVAVAALVIGAAAGAGITIAVRGATSSTSSGANAVENCLQAPVLCYTPLQFDTAYGVEPLVQRGIDGRGETVALAELAIKPPLSPPGVTDIREDLHGFDTLFHLPAANLSVETRLAGSSAPYLANGEEAQDVEMVHAVAPGAAIVVVLVPSDSTGSAASFSTAVTEVIDAGISQGAEVVSISGSHGEHVLTRAEVASIHTALQQARDHHITVVAASGDSGAVSDQGLPTQVSLPASDPLALSVGGTSLDADPSTGAYYGETVWNHVNAPGDDDASGGGFSDLYTRPAYQDGVTRITAMRGVPDVSADADSATGMAGVLADGHTYTVIPARGTSASTPLWAGIIALADQYAHHPLGFVDTGIYRIAASPSYHEAFHDITIGDNTVALPTTVVAGYQASPGWDPVTGWGTPNAQILVPLLPSYVHIGDGSGL